MLESVLKSKIYFTLFNYYYYRPMLRLSVIALALAAIVAMGSPLKPNTHSERRLMKRDKECLQESMTCFNGTLKCKYVCQKCESSGLCSNAIYTKEEDCGECPIE